MAGESSYVERVPAPALAALAPLVWIQQVGERPVAQRHVPHGGGELVCLLGEALRLLGPLTASTYREIPAGGTVVGVRLRPGVLGGLVGMPADELVDQDVAGTDIWRGLGQLTDLLGDAATLRVALDDLQELHRILRLQGFIARVQASVAEPGAVDVNLARWAVETGYTDQAHLGRECRRLIGVTPGEFLAQNRAGCGCGRDHAASYVPVLRPGDGRLYKSADRSPLSVGPCANLPTPRRWSE